jgi:superfamily II DNA/RNA helicase
MEEVKGGKDKLAVLRDVLARHHSKGQRTLIFCNTVSSCRAVEFAINQDAVAGGSFAGSGEVEEGVGYGDTEGGGGIRVTTYHGDLTSYERQENLERFRAGTSAELWYPT